MYIVDKHTDYYDHFSYIYGVDKKVIYDRRGSNKITDEDLFNLLPTYWNNHPSGRFLLLEVGNIQYLVEVNNIIFKKSNLPTPDCFSSFDLSLIFTFNTNKHYYDSPMSIRSVIVNYNLEYKKPNKLILTQNFNETIVKASSKVYENPILSGTSLTKILEAEVLWKELQNYLSGLNNDVDIDIMMSDKERAEIHGFDKHSFRNPIR